MSGLKKLFLLVYVLISLQWSQHVAGQNLYPFDVVNKAQLSKNVSHTYLILMAKTLDKSAKQSGLKFTYDKGRNAQVGSLVPLTAGSMASSFIYQIDTMKGYDAKTHTIRLLIPQLQSGRAMVSINYPLEIGVIKNKDGTFAFQPPNVNNPSDPNYSIIYDKFEFTYDNKTNKGATPNGTLYINPTAVDFFSIPINLSTKKKNSGMPLSVARATLMDTISNVISRNDKTKTKKWNALKIIDPTTRTMIRVASPSVAPDFDTTYLQSATGFNYIQSTINYYKKNTMVVDCSELYEPGEQVYDKYKQTPAQDKGAYFFTGKIDANSIFQFVNKPKSGSVLTVTVDMNNARSSNFFGPGKAPFDTPNKTVKSIIIKNLASAFSVGLLPAPDGDTLSKAYFKPKLKQYYKSNPLNPATAQNTGPWYDLYAKAIHSTNGVIYAYAYDDVLAQDGTISSTDLTEPITITIGDLGDIAIPNPKASYKVQPVTITKVDPFVCKDSLCTVTVYWEVPKKQSSNAQYFLNLAGGGGGFSISTEDVVKMQVGKLIPYDQGKGSLTLNKKYLGKNPATIKMQVFTCGQSGCVCPTATTYKKWNCAMGSNIFPK